MSLIIGSQAFDLFDGVVKMPERRVAVYSPTTQEHVGSQVLPKRGPEFKLRTTRYCATADRRMLAQSYIAMYGEIHGIVEDGLDYSLGPYNVRFLIVSVNTNRIGVLAHASGVRNSVKVSYSPAGVVETEWMLRAVPVS